MSQNARKSNDIKRSLAGEASGRSHKLLDWMRMITKVQAEKVPQLGIVTHLKPCRQGLPKPWILNAFRADMESIHLVIAKQFSENLEGA
jgi:hypothetical protein